MFKYRLNPINIDCYMDFGRIRGSRNSDIRNTYMVKFTGATADTLKDINDLFTYLSKEMREGKIYYKYINSFQIENNCMTQKTAYENFVAGGHIDILKTSIAESELADAIKKLQNLLHKYKKNLTETIQKNITVKLLYWLCENFSDIKIDGGKNIKVVAQNIKQIDIKKYNDIPVNKDENRVRISLESVRRKDRDSKTAAKTEGSMAANTNHISNIRTAKAGSVLPDTNIPDSGVKRDRELSYIELAKLSTSIVMIAVYDGRQKMLGTGSGIMIGKDGFILTNDHVIRGGHHFEVRIEDDERTYKTDEVIKYNQYLDLAIIRIPRVLNPLRLYSGSKKLVRGQKVVAIGSPLGLFNSVSDGIISGFRNIDNVDMIQFSAPTSPGSSGGAVLNMYGEIIGISTAGFSEGQNINLAVPYDAIYGFAKSFIR